VSVRHGRRRRREALLAYALILPSLLVFAVFVFYPFLRNFWLAMYATPPFPGMPRQRVGFRQYRRVLDLGTMGHAFVTVLPWAVAIGVLAAVAGIVVARRRGVAGAARRFAVWALAAEVVLGLWRFTVDSGSDFANSFRVTVVFAILTVPAGIALGLGLAVLAHQRLAGIAVYRTIFFAFVVGGIFAFQTFGQIDLLTNGGPVKKTNVLTYSIYTTLRAQQDEGRAAVLAIALFAVTLGLTLVQLRLLERRVTYAR
jgi:sn-glycerol 3-phosphate transport system permease protein